jgi:hypothetical protein
MVIFSKTNIIFASRVEVGLIFAHKMVEAPMEILQSNMNKVLIILPYLFLFVSRPSIGADTAPGNIGITTSSPTPPLANNGGGSAPGRNSQGASPSPTPPRPQIPDSKAVPGAFQSTGAANGALQNLANNPSNVSAINGANGALNNMALSHMALLKDVASGNFDLQRLPELTAAMNSSAGSITLPKGLDGSSPAVAAKPAPTNLKMGVPTALGTSAAPSPVGESFGLANLGNTASELQGSVPSLRAPGSSVPSALSNNQSNSVKGIPDPEIPGVSYIMNLPGSAEAKTIQAANAPVPGQALAQESDPAHALRKGEPSSPYNKKDMTMAKFFAALKMAQDDGKKPETAKIGAGTEVTPTADPAKPAETVVYGGVLPEDANALNENSLLYRARRPSSLEGEESEMGESRDGIIKAGMTAPTTAIEKVVEGIKTTAGENAPLLVFLGTAVAFAFFMMEFLRIRVRRSEMKWTQFEKEYRRLFEQHSPLIMTVAPESVGSLAIETSKDQAPQSLEKTKNSQYVIWLDAKTKNWVLGKQAGDGSEVQVLGTLKSGSKIKTTRIRGKEKTGIVELKRDGSFVYVDQEKEAYLYSAKRSA